MHYTTRLIFLAALCGLTAHAQIINSNVFTREGLTSAANKAVARALIGLFEWTTNSVPAYTGNHSSEAALDVDDVLGDAGVRFKYGTNEYMLMLYGTNLNLVSALDGSTPAYVASPGEAAMLNYKSLTNLFVMKTNDYGHLTILTADPTETISAAETRIYSKIGQKSRATLFGQTLSGSTNLAGEVVMVGPDAVATVDTIILGDTNLVAEIGKKQATNVVADLAALAVYSGAEDTVMVTDLETGGTFTRSSGLAVDGGVVVTNTVTDDIFVRQFSGRIDVRWFGAVPDDLVDDSTAIQAAIDYSTRNVVAPDYYTEDGGAAMDVYVPQGIYTLNTGLTAKLGLRLFGDGSSTILRYSGTGNAITIDNQARGRSPIVIKDLQLKKVTASTTGAAIAFVETHTPSTNWNCQVDFQNIVINGEFGTPGTGSWFGFGIDYSPGTEARIQGGYIRNVAIANCTTNGVRLASVATGLTLDGVYVESCAGHGFYVTGYPSYTSFINCLSDNNGGDGYNVTNSSASISFIGCGAENTSTNALTEEISTGVPFRLANGTFTLVNPYAYTTTNRSAIVTHNVKSLQIIDPWLYSKPATGGVPDTANYGLEVAARTHNRNISINGGYFYGFDANCNVVLPDAVSSSDMEAATLGSDLITETSTDWTLGSGWSTNGMDWIAFHHATGGGTNALEFTIGEATGTRVYLLTYTVVGTASGQLHAGMASIGNSLPQSPYNGGGIGQTFREAIKSVSDGKFAFLPVNTFDGYLTNISIQRAESTNAPVWVLQSSTTNHVMEIHSDSTNRNTFIGTEAGMANVAGYQNVALGHGALKSLVSGYWETALGYKALEYDVSGTRNVAVGDFALRSMTSGQRNTAVGSMAGTSLTTGCYNTLIGKDAGYSLTSASNNVAIGYYALGLTPTTTYESTAVGYRAGAGGTSSSGYGNTFVGYMAGNAYTSADFTTSIGRGSGYYLTTGDENTFLGNYAGRYLKTGDKNVMLGALAGHDYTDVEKMSEVDSMLVLIGYNATRSDVRANATALTNAVAIGAYSQVGAHNTMVLGGTGNYAMSVVAGATNAATSALLDLNSTTKGFLMPRMTTVQREAISTPAEGLAVWDLTLHKVYYWDATHWTNGW